VTGRGWLALVLALTLFARLAVPAGFMPAVVQGTTLLRLCPGAGDLAPAMAAMPGHHHHSHGEDHDKAEAPCAFAGLGLAMTGPVGPALLVAALLFAFVQALLVAAPFLPASAQHLRPPLRAPPLAA
jgi:hypothetical protein